MRALFFAMLFLLCNGCVVGINEASEICKRKGFSPQTVEFNECGIKESSIPKSKNHFHEEWVKSFCNRDYSGKMENLECLAKHSKDSITVSYNVELMQCYRPLIADCLQRVSLIESSLTQQEINDYQDYCKKMTSSLFFTGPIGLRVTNCDHEASVNRSNRLRQRIEADFAAAEARIERMRLINKAFQVQPFNASDTNSPNSNNSSIGCRNDFECSYGSSCVKKQFSSAGFCAVNVNENGLKTFSPPSTDSVGIEMYAQCRLDSECPSGFVCLNNHCLKKK